MNSIDWALLRSFLAVVETGSLSSAASRLSTSQPTLSRHIRELELTIGISLFTRSARGLEPTEAALGLIDDAHAMGEAAQALTLKAQGRSQQLTGTVRITASVIVANLLLPPILAGLRQAEPNIQIEIVASDLSQNLLRRDADIALRMFDPPQGALIARKLGDAPLGLFGQTGYFARRGSVNTVQDLLEHDVIGFDRSDLIIRSYATSGLSVTRENFPIRCDDQMVYWNLLLAGAGLGVAQTLVASRHPELKRVDVGMRVPSLPFWLVMHEDVRGNARIRRVADYLSATLKDLLLRDSDQANANRDASIL